MVLFTLNAQVAGELKFATPKNRDYETAKFFVTANIPSFVKGDDGMPDIQGGRSKRYWVGTTHDVAARLRKSGLRLNERIILHVVEIDAFGGNDEYTDANGNKRTGRPMVALTITDFELPGRYARNEYDEAVVAAILAKVDAIQAGENVTLTAEEIAVIKGDTDAERAAELAMVQGVTA